MTYFLIYIIILTFPMAVIWKTSPWLDVLIKFGLYIAAGGSVFFLLTTLGYLVKV